MKHLLFLSIATIFLFTTGYGQKGWAIGDKTAFGHSWTVGNRPDNVKRSFHPTFLAGRNAVYNFNENTGIGFGTFFNTEGNTYENTSLDVKLIHRTNYIRIPVFASFTFGSAFSKIRPRLAVGPNVGFLVGGKSIALADNNNFVGAKATTAMDTKIDAGINGSLGLSVKVTDGVWFNQDINYYHGLVEQSLNPNTVVLNNDMSYTNRNLSLSMGFLINSHAMKNWKRKMSHRRR